MNNVFPDPSESPWVNPETGIEFVFDLETGSWAPGIETTPGVEETLDAVSKRGSKTDVNITVGSVIGMDDGEDAYNGGPHELEATSGEDVDTNWDAWVGHPFSNKTVSWTCVEYVKDSNNPAIANGAYIAFGDSNAVGPYKVYFSHDGKRWSTHDLPDHDSVGLCQTLDLEYANGIFVAPSMNGQSVSTSRDGINWQRQDGLEGSWYSVAYGNGKFVVVGESTLVNGDRSIMTSPDGINWTIRSAPNTAVWREIIYAQGKFVAVGEKRYLGPDVNVVMTSVDGENWTLRSSPKYKWQSISYNDGKFVAVSGGSPDAKSMVSPNGEGWNMAYDMPGGFYEKVEYGGGRFVAVSRGTEAKIASSTDGASWTEHIAPGSGTEGWKGLTYGGSKFVAVSGFGEVNVMTLETPEKESGLYFDGDLIATSQNLLPLIQEININTDEIAQLDGKKLPYDILTLPSQAI